MYENSGRIRLQEYTGFGGQNFDSTHLSRFFNYDKPHDFGVMVAKIFSSSNRFYYKPLTEMTEGVGSVYEIDGDMYRWTLFGDDYRKNYVAAFVETGNSRIGWNNQEFKIGLEEPWYRQPDILMGENNNYMLQVVGTPIQKGTYYEYTVKLLTSNPNDYVDSADLQEGRYFCKASTSVGIEMNQDYGTTSMGTQVDLQSQIGAYGNKFEVSDRVIREELNAKKNGSKGMRETPYTSGYTFSLFNPKTRTVIEKGGFVTFMEARIIEETQMDREIMNHFGKATISKDSTNRYIKKTGPGMRQLQKDGFEMIHNGSLTTTQLENFFDSILLTRVPEGNRDIVLDTGSLGMRIFDQMLSDEAAGYLTLDRHYIREIPGAQAGDLEYGYQYKSYRAKNGLRIRLVHNPMKDDPMYCGRRHPLNPQYTVDSARMDIYDLGSASNSAFPNSSNMAMVKTRGVDEYFWTGGAVDPRTGVINNGSLTSSAEKAVTCRYGLSGSVVVWDTTRLATIIYEPNI